MDTPIVELRHFIQAIRDAGYRSTGAALAELIDNSFEAEAQTVEIDIRGSEKTDSRVISVRDDGNGMSPSVLRAALQFGGSSRFGQRRGTGRFGMGLPNSSVSQARRVELYSWTAPCRTWWSYIDVDEIKDGNLSAVPEPRRRRLPAELGSDSTNNGTVVVWHRCDRVSLKRESSLVKQLRSELGRIFRMMLWDGRKLNINGKAIMPVDPLFLRNGENLKGAKMYGPIMEYDVKGNELDCPGQSKIVVRFAELPVREWIGMSNREKSGKGISKSAGISVLRAGREIDFGWYFMGGKRKENYDDWWRCEVEFQPELDELFGVTHTKQGITPSETLLQLMSPDLEQIAHILNARVRKAFLSVKERKILPSERRAAECDSLFVPPQWTRESAGTEWQVAANTTNGRGVAGMQYRLVVKKLDVPEIYVGKLCHWGFQLILNEQHPFCDRFYTPLTHAKQCDAKRMCKALELLLFAAVRAEGVFTKKEQSVTLAAFKKQWSNIVAAFLA
jgi:hypothetical protein